MMLFFVCLYVCLRIGSEGWWLVWRAAAACLPLIIVNQRTGSWDGQNFHLLDFFLRGKDQLNTQHNNYLTFDLEVLLITAHS